MLAPTEPGVHVITAKVATQLLKTSLLENVFGYHAHLDPCPILLVQPKEDAAEQFSKERITPLIKATPVLRRLIGSGKTRSAEDTLVYKAFPGGFLALVGAGSPDNLARRPVRIVAYDEVDKYPPLVEGDALDIGDERTATFPANWLSIRVCSPTIEDESRIDASYLSSDQRQASIVCPHCEHRQFLDFFKSVQWDKAKDGSHRPTTAMIYCEACGVGWKEGERLKALSSIRYHQTRPFTCCDERQQPLEAYDKAWRRGDTDPVGAVWDWWSSERHAVYRVKCSKCGAWSVSNEHAGFTASKLFSPWSGKDGPVALAKKWLAAKDDPTRRQVFVNTQLALVYRRHSGKELKIEALLARRASWAGHVASGVAVLTVGVDVQAYRVEVEVVGWGRDEESWSLGYEIIDGEFAEPETQRLLDEYLKRVWTRADGRPFVASAVCIDSGGTHTQAVYDFAKARLGRKVWAIKGESAQAGQRNPIWPTKRPSSRTKKTFRPVILGVNAAKDAIRDSLLKDAPGPRFMHYGLDRDVSYFEQLTAERLTLKTVGVRKFMIWEPIPGRANEALDCRVYAMAALKGLEHQGLKLNRRAEEVGAAITPWVRTVLVPEPTPEPEPAPLTPGPTQPVGPAVVVQKKPSRASRLA